MYGQDIVRRPLKNMTLSAALKKRMDFSEVTGGPRRAPRPGLGLKARPSRRALSFRKLLINWLLGQKCESLIMRDASKALHLILLGTLTGLTSAKRRRYQFPILIYLCLTPSIK